ncbi:rRNA cytosine-C5-methyltransferase [Paenibacillus sp. FSL R7-0273]|uniref:RsmB/NOP family class I SAM-dependent RNA methyltransferase n=1 Tax=Paenibacillus sp. FSL R7-0273 TaxID=1536772 RepID=UPI0004F752E2|nr:RsmB/NOP family class I SAM-dependent RNA methyltransferase [Paenibacillus sp. FSL R7-0273]AIQ46443.1 rRNA cytosine-C5-methyltransferase [Paenibacillus sp. FSL R7-0273]OMF86782.1 rRNA cytosine-C5-methyltransferase [Paenibacillus sp. FSL R7-0273]
MAAQLPGSFTGRMKELLGTEYESFLETYKETPYAGIRVNTLKITVQELLERSPFGLEPIPWCPAGFYTEEGARPGKHPYYHAGLYYIQEPSAMAPVELLDVQPGDRVLDLCAAPGGKSTQIAAKLQGTGMLVSNDLHPDRTKALAKNLELYGVRNGIVLNESPERIAAAFPGFFDRILIDAPCSGEGMFRKDEDMVKQWEPGTPQKYADMQREILRSAAAALKPGGTIVYSTCTFAPEENEGSILEFLAGQPQFTAVPAGGSGGFAPGLSGLPEAVRLWPHKVKGEGHFMAVLRHDGSAAAQGTAGDADTALPVSVRSKGSSAARPAKAGGSRDREAKGGRGQGKGGGARGQRPQGSGEEAALAAFAGFCREQLGWQPAGYPVLFGEHLYISPLPPAALDGLRTIRPGWYMGQLRSGRFIPGHPLATALRPSESLRSLSLDSANGEAVSYLKGETLAAPEQRLSVQPGSPSKGYVLVCIDSFSAGWGKWQDGMLKNEYPAGWRWT